MATRLVFAALAVMLAGVMPVSADSLSDNKAVVEAFVRIGNSRDFDRLAEVVSEDFVRHCQATPGIDVRSLDDFRAFMEADLEAFPDSQVEVQQMVAEGDRVAVWATYSGTQQGAMGHLPATGKMMSVDFGAIFRIDDSKIVELWVTWDNMAALGQLGHMSPPGSGKAE